MKRDVWFRLFIFSLAAFGVSCAGVDSNTGTYTKGADQLLPSGPADKNPLAIVGAALSAPGVILKILGVKPTAHIHGISGDCEMHVISKGSDKIMRCSNTYVLVFSRNGERKSQIWLDQGHFSYSADPGAEFQLQAVNDSNGTTSKIVTVKAPQVVDIKIVPE